MCGSHKQVFPLLFEVSDDSHTPAGGFYFLSNGIHTAEQAFCHGSAQDGHVAALVHLHVGEIASCTVLQFSALVEFKGGSDDIDPFNRIGPEFKHQIGRASWRESVCQYGSLSVVAVTLKKKK